MDLAVAASRLSRPQANALVRRLLEKYEPAIPNAPAGSRYQDCCDTDTGRPGPAYLDLLEQVKNELAGLGLSL